MNPSVTRNSLGVAASGQEVPGHDRSTQTINLAAIFYKEDARRRSLDAISIKRRNPPISMTKAAKLSGTTLKTIRKYGAPALETRSGRVDVKLSDRLERRMRLLTPQGGGSHDKKLAHRLAAE